MDDYASRDVVIKALRAAGPPHSPHRLVVSPKGFFTTIATDDGKKLACEYLPEKVSRRTVNRLCRRCKVPKPWFYDVLLIPGDEEKQKPC